MTPFHVLILYETADIANPSPTVGRINRSSGFVHLVQVWTLQSEDFYRLLR